MLAEYCNETITVKTKSSINEYNEPTYTTRTIIARFQYGTSLVVTQDGTKVVSNATLFTKSQITDLDIISYDGKNWPVLNIVKLTDIENYLIGYEAKL